MKLFLFTLALIFTAQLAFAQSGYVELGEQEAQDSTVQGLRLFGWKYVLQQGVFQSTKLPLENGNWEVFSIKSTERRTSGPVTYYRFTVQLGLDYGDRMIIQTRYVVSYRPSNGRFLISSWSYSIVQGSTTEEVGTGGPYLEDIRPVNDGTNDISSVLDDAIPKVVEAAIAAGDLPDATYRLRYVYNVGNAGESPPNYSFLVSLVSSGGKYYRVRIGLVDNTEVEEIPEPEPTYSINPF